MGLNMNSTRLFLRLKKQGISFGKMLTIGRQGLYMRQKALEKNLKDYQYSGVDVKAIFTKEKGFAEPFFELLGASKVQSLDASTYENASIVHDMNFPIEDNLHQQYDTVFDGGSLEHVFNFPVALKNCMEMVAEGGHFLSISPANNYYGHGFYQLSPELYFRSLSEENGFKIKEILFFKHTKDSYDQQLSPVFKIKDPAAIRRRIEMVNAEPICLFIVAQRVAIKPIFSTYPQQSDYEKIAWKKERGKKKKKQNKPLLNFFRKATPNALLKIRRKFILVSRTFGNSKKEFFEKIEY